MVILNACPGWLEGITEACLGGVEQNKSFSRGYLQSGGGGEEGVEILQKLD